MNELQSDAPAFIEQPPFAPTPALEEARFAQVSAHHRPLVLREDLAERDIDIPRHRRDGLLHLREEVCLVGWWHFLRRHTPENNMRGFRPARIFRKAKKLKDRAHFLCGRLRSGQVAWRGWRVSQLHLSGLDRSRKNDATGVVPSREGCWKARRRQKFGTSRRLRGASKSNEGLTGHLKGIHLAMTELVLVARQRAYEEFGDGEGLRFGQHDGKVGLSKSGLVTTPRLIDSSRD